MEQAAKASPRVHYGFVVLVMIVLGIMAALGLGRFGYSIVLPTMQESLKLTNTQAGELQSWNLVGYSLAVIGAGMLAARYSTRVIVSVSTLLVAISMLLTGIAPGFDLIRWARFLTGLGAGGVNVPAMALVPSWFGAKRRGVASGIAVAGSSFGLMVSGPLVPIIISQYGPDQGWRISWFIFGGMAIVIAVLAFTFLRNRPAELGLTRVGDEANNNAPAASASSLDWGHVFKSRALWHLTLIYFCFGLSYTIYFTFFVRYLVKEGGFSQADAGALWFQVGVGTAVSGFIWGSVSDRWGRRTALMCVFAIQTVSYLMFGLVQNAPGFYISAFLFSITAWSIPALMAAICGDLFGARFAPAAFGFITFLFGIGQAIGPVLAGAIADATGSFARAFVIAGIVAVAGVGGSAFLRIQKSH